MKRYVLISVAVAGIAAIVGMFWRGEQSGLTFRKPVYRTYGYIVVRDIPSTQPSDQFQLIQIPSTQPSTSRVVVSMNPDTRAEAKRVLEGLIDEAMARAMSKTKAADPSTRSSAPAATRPVAVGGGNVVSYGTVLKQLTSDTRKIAGQAARPVANLDDGLSDVQRVCSRPILAVAERGDWFFYATSVARESSTHQPVSFIAGYAVKKNGREIIEWSVW